MTWETISPDLTAHEPTSRASRGEPITRDITGEEIYSTLYAMRESPTREGRDLDGRQRRPRARHARRRQDLEERHAEGPAAGRPRAEHRDSPHRKGSAYIAAYRYLLDDFQPYIYRTDDYGATWTRLTDGKNGIPADYPTRVVREDPDREGLLYAGTEFGMFISFDNGRHWQPFQQNLPVTPVTDISVHPQDLVLSTMGAASGSWTTSRRCSRSPTALARGAATFQLKSGLLDLREAWRMRYTPAPAAGPTSRIPGARSAHRLLPGRTRWRIDPRILDAGGNSIPVLLECGAAGRPAAASRRRHEDMPRRGGGAAVRLSASAGMHRFAWDLRLGTGDAMRGAAGRWRCPGGTWCG